MRNYRDLALNAADSSLGDYNHRKQVRQFECWLANRAILLAPIPGVTTTTTALRPASAFEPIRLRPQLEIPLYSSPSAQHLGCGRSKAALECSRKCIQDHRPATALNAGHRDRIVR